MPLGSDERGSRSDRVTVSDDPAQIPSLSQVANDLIDLPFDRYQLIRVLGEGAMGVVYEARQHEPARTVAVKIMKSRHSSLAAEARFIRESRLLATLNHPHVAQLYDAGIHRSGVLTVPFCVMELVRGASSITAFAQANRLPLRQRIELFLQVCAGVRHVHEHGIVHCDLKPSNILVNDQGHVKVIDFGVARTMQLDDSGGTVWSDASLIFGTPQYMSPEQARGHNLDIGERSDVYALGIVLYELLCHRLPYNVDRTSAITAARSILESEPLAPGKVDRSLRGDVEKVLYRALAKEPERRYRSLHEFEDELKCLLAGKPIARGRDRLYVARRFAARWVARHRLFTIAAVILATTALCAIVGGGIANRGANRWYDLFVTQRVRHVPSTPLRHVVIVTIGEGTDLATLAGAREGSLPTEDNSRRFYGRRAHARFIDRLVKAGARPRAIAFDIWFRDDGPWDGELADAVRRVDVPVVVGTGGPTPSSPENGNIATALRGLVFAGGIFGVTRDDAPWAACLVTTTSNGAILPSLSLATVSQFWHPNSRPAMEWQPNAINLRYPAGGERPVPITSIIEMLDDDPSLGVRRGTAMAEFMIEMPTDNDLDASSADFRAVLQWSDAQLRERFNDRVVLVGDSRAASRELRQHPDGRTLAACIVHAMAIERLLDGQTLRRPPFISAIGAHVSTKVPILLVTSVAGVILASLLRRRPWLRWSAYAVGLCVLSVAALLSFRIGGFIYSPLTPALCLLTAGAGAGLVWKARESAV